MANYLTNTNELTSIANAIRAKGGTSSSLTYPSGFISAIEAISTSSSTSSGGGEWEDISSSFMYIDPYNESLSHPITAISNRTYCIVIAEWWEEMVDPPVIIAKGNVLPATPVLFAIEDGIDYTNGYLWDSIENINDYYETELEGEGGWKNLSYSRLSYGTNVFFIAIFKIGG